MMGLLFSLTGAMAAFGLDFAERHKWLPAAWFAETPLGATMPLTIALATAGVEIVTFFAFLMAMRLTALAGYHGGGASDGFTR